MVNDSSYISMHLKREIENFEKYLCFSSYVTGN